MRRWMIWLGSGASASVMVAGGVACGEASVDDCSANGTCAMQDGGPDEVVLVEGGPQPDHASNSPEAAAGDGNGGPDGAVGSDGSAGGDAADGESGVTCDGESSLVCGGECVASSDPMHCGSCGNVCAAPASGHGQATCAVAGSSGDDGGEGGASGGDGGLSCGVTCAMGYHACSGDCLADADEP